MSTASKLSVEFKNAPRDASLVPCSASSALNRFCKDCEVALTDENWQDTNRRNHIYLCRRCSSNRRVKWQRENRERDRQNQRRQKFELKKSVIEHYGNICACCSESGIKFLTIDHINGEGNKHKRFLYIKTGHRFYAWLRSNNYPSGFQVLCFNCNLGKNRYGVCPHDKEEFSRVIEETYRAKNNVNRVRKSLHKLRLEVIEGYGGKCEICGEDNSCFLTIHHRFNDGNIERKNESWQTLYRRLKKENFSKDSYQLLCFNCNCSQNR